MAAVAAAWLAAAALLAAARAAAPSTSPSGCMCGNRTCCTAAAMSIAFTCRPCSLSTSCSLCSMPPRLRLSVSVTEVSTLPTVPDTVCAARLAAVVDAFWNCPEATESRLVRTAPDTSALTRSITGARDDVSAAATICATCALLGAAPPAAAAGAAPAAAALAPAAAAAAGCCPPAAGALASAAIPVPRPVSTVLVRRPANCSTSAGLLKSGRARVSGRPACNTQHGRKQWLVVHPWVII